METKIYLLKLWDRFDFIYTPKHGSWLNMAEIELHVLNGQCLNRHIATLDKIKEEVSAWQENRNNKKRQNKLAVYQPGCKNKTQKALSVNSRLT